MVQSWLTLVQGRRNFGSFSKETRGESSSVLSKQVFKAVRSRSIFTQLQNTEIRLESS